MVIRQHSAPAQDASTVTPGSSALAKPAKALYVGGTGNVTVRTLAGSDVEFESVPAGSMLPISCSHVLGDTTATLIVALHEE